MSTQHTPSDNAATKFAASLIPLDNYDGELTDMDCRLLEQFGPAEMSRIIQALFRQNDDLLEALEKAHQHIEEMQAKMVAYILPDSEVTNQDFISQIIYMLDGPEQRELEAALKAARAKARGEA